MKIKLSPMRLDQKLTLRKEGDTLYVNEEAFDFSTLPEGATLPKEAINCMWFASGVERQDGELRFGIVLPHGASAPLKTLFPELIQIDKDGSVVLPLYDADPVDVDGDYLDNIEEAL